MTSATSLPAALAPWSRQLAALVPEVALAAGPMLRRLDEFVGRRLDAEAGDGPPDGFDGLARRGAPEHLLMSEWLLAQDVPEEFWRRAAQGELLHLATARRGEASSGATVLLVDTGPDLLGAPRLVQLAMILVLHRRAEASGAPLRVGLLGTEPGSWLDGDLLAVLEAWLAGRGHGQAPAAGLGAWLGRVDRPREAWVLTDERLAREAGAEGIPAARLVTLAEADWDADGPRAVVATVPGERLHLPLPDPDSCLRVLRGRGWRRPRGTAASAAGGARFPTFNGHGSLLLARGPGAHRLVTHRVGERIAPGARPRHHAFAGPVLAAAAVGGRLVVVTARHGHARVEVTGRRLGRLDGMTVPLAQLGLTATDVEDLAEGPPSEVFFRSGALLLPLGGRWWELEPGEGARRRPSVVAVATTRTVDLPVVARRGSSGLIVEPTVLTGPLVVPDASAAFVLTGELVAWQDGGGAWAAMRLPGAGRAVPRPGDSGHRYPVDDGASVIGVVGLDRGPALVTLGAGGRLVKLVGHDGTTVLTVWSGGESPPAIHPRYRLVAAARPGGRIEVGDLLTGRVLLRLDGSS